MNYEFFIDGAAKMRSNWIVSLFFILYFITLILLFPPVSILNALLWIYCLLFIVLSIYSPKYWLMFTVLSICTMGLIPNFFGVFNKEYVDGSILGIKNLQHINVPGYKGRVISLPLLGLPPSIFLWWIREKEILIPHSFISMAVFVLMAVASCLLVCLELAHISLAPLSITISMPDYVVQSQLKQNWWQAGMPYTLMAFTFMMTIGYVVGIFLLLSAYNLIRRNPTLLNSLYSALAISTVICTIYGLLQIKGIVPVFTKYGDYESTFQSQGCYGVFVGITCAFFYSRIFLSRERNVANIALFAIAALGLFINQTRTALFALIITIFIIHAWYLYLRRKNIIIMDRGKQMLSIMVMVAVLISIATLNLPQVSRAIVENGHNSFVVGTVKALRVPKDLSALDDISSLRISIWSKCIDIWRENPILGCGQGQLYWELKSRGVADTAANQFILVLSEMGILGLFIFLLVLVSVGKDLIRPFGAKDIKLNYSNWIICSAMVVNIFIQALTVHIFHFPNLPLLIWIIIGMALASSREDLKPGYPHYRTSL